VVGKREKPIHERARMIPSESRVRTHKWCVPSDVFDSHCQYRPIATGSPNKIEGCASCVEDWPDHNCGENDCDDDGRDRPRITPPSWRRQARGSELRNGRGDRLCHNAQTVVLLSATSRGGAPAA
jgi:hypothetical protein